MKKAVSPKVTALCVSDRSSSGSVAAAAAATAVAATSATAVAAATAGAATAAAVAATTAAAVSAAAAAVAARTVFTRTGFVDDDGAAVERLAVHPVDGRLRLGIGTHLDEAEALGAAGVAIHHDLRRGHGAELRK